jgi:hypothetical protein
VANQSTKPTNESGTEPRADPGVNHAKTWKIHFPFLIRHFETISLVHNFRRFIDSSLSMTNEKWKMTNGK